MTCHTNGSLRPLPQRAIEETPRQASTRELGFILSNIRARNLTEKLGEGELAQLAAEGHTITPIRCIGRDYIRCLFTFKTIDATSFERAMIMLRDDFISLAAAPEPAVVLGDALPRNHSEHIMPNQRVAIKALARRARVNYQAIAYCLFKNRMEDISRDAGDAFITYLKRLINDPAEIEKLLLADNPADPEERLLDDIAATILIRLVERDEPPDWTWGRAVAIEIRELIERSNHEI